MKWQEKAKVRQMNVSETYQYDANYPFKGEGFCVWCQKPFDKPRKGKHFCSHLPGKWYSDCYTEFMGWWCSVPRFKRVVFLRDNFTCQSCGVKPIWVNRFGVTLPDLSKLAVDHKHPVAKGGKTEFSNLQCLCRKCNAKKSDKVGWQLSEVMQLDIPKPETQEKLI